MRAVKSKAFWFFIGIIGTHIGHFIYQAYYAQDFTGIKVSEAIAMIVEDLIQLILQFLDTVIPILASSRQLALGILVVLILMMASFIWLRIYFRIKNGSKSQAKIMEAETVLTNAKKQAAAKLKKIELLKIRLNKEFAKKESSLQNELKEKIKEYMVRIKALEKERMELKRINSNLMQKLKSN